MPFVAMRQTDYRTKKWDFDTRQEQKEFLCSKTSTNFKETPSFYAVSNEGCFLADKAEEKNTKTKSNE
jgi:hypothetical protein